MHFRRILFATDGSDAAIRAATALAQMSGRDQETSVTVVAAVPNAIDAAESDESQAWIHPDGDSRAAANRALNKTEAVFLKWGIPHSGLIVEGDCACTAIAAAARHDLCDLIVLSGEEKAEVADGESSTERLAEEVRRRATVPVLLVPAHAG